MFKLMNFRSFLFFIFLFFTSSALAGKDVRVIILADMGNEPDEEQQMVHMLTNSNEFHLEGLIAVTGKFLRKDPQPELFFDLLEAYELALPNLLVHSKDFPDTGYLQSIVRAGQNKYGIEDVKKGVKTSPGSRLIERSLASDDPRPLNIIVNAGANTFAQALVDFESKVDAKTFKKALAKIRVFENGSQDNAGAWIAKNYPDILWIRSNFQTYSYGGPRSANNGAKVPKNLGPYVWEPYPYTAVGQHMWALEHVKADHGPLGLKWPIRQFPSGRVAFTEGGGTIPWLAVVNKGLYDVDHPHWGGWGGRYTKEKVKNFWSRHKDIKVDEVKLNGFYVHAESPDTWTDPDSGKTHVKDNHAPVWRWRRAMFNNQRCRMDWAKESKYENANHHPIAAIGKDLSNKIIRLSKKAGSTIKLDASKSKDPDGDNIDYNWFHYLEAGTYPTTLKIADPDSSKIKLQIPKDAKGKQIHIILEIKDDSKIASLYDYRRVVVDVK